MPLDSIPIVLHHTLTDTNSPSLLYAGEPAIGVGPAHTRVWIGDGNVNRLLLSTNAADTPLVRGFIEAPTDGFIHARRGSNRTWQALTRANNTTALGEGALALQTTGTNNTAVGWNALNGIGVGAHNTAVGNAALRSTNTGTNNTAVGSGALQVNNTTSNNTAVGFNALAANHTWGAGNTAVGSSALLNNVSGTLNTAVGTSALSGNSAGSNNVAVGSSALTQNIAGSNIAIGRSALASINQSGSSSNVAVGDTAASNFGGGGTTATLARTVTRSVFLGAVAQPQADGQTNQIVIGANAIGHGSNTAQIGDADVTQLWIGNARVTTEPTTTGSFLRTGAGAWIAGCPEPDTAGSFLRTGVGTWVPGVPEPTSEGQWLRSSTGTWVLGLPISGSVRQIRISSWSGEWGTPRMIFDGWAPWITLYSGGNIVGGAVPYTISASGNTGWPGSTVNTLEIGRGNTTTGQPLGQASFAVFNPNGHLRLNMRLQVGPTTGEAMTNDGTINVSNGYFVNGVPIRDTIGIPQIITVADEDAALAASTANPNNFYVWVE